MATSKQKNCYGKNHIHPQMQPKYKLKDYTINLCQKIIVEHLPEKLIEVLNASIKSSCESLVTDGKYPRNDMKSISHIETVTNLFLKCVFF